MADHGDWFMETHMQEVGGQIAEWVADVAWKVWNWRAERAAVFYARLDQEAENRGGEADGPAHTAWPLRIPDDEVRSMPTPEEVLASESDPEPAPVIVECPRNTCKNGRLESCWPIEQDVLYCCEACQEPGDCHTAHCDSCGSYKICSGCMYQAGVFRRMWPNRPGCNGGFSRRFQVYTAKKPKTEPKPRQREIESETHQCI